MPGVKVDDLAKVLTKELVGYRQEIADQIKREVKAVAKDTAQQIKNAAPRDSGEYAAGWDSRVEFENESDIRIRIYNKKKPQLSHLLENGHAKVGGGRVNGKAHIGPAEQKAERKLLGKVKVIIQ